MSHAIEPVRPDWSAPPSVRAAVSTRSGGVSRGVYASLNLGARVGDDPDLVDENRTRLRRALALPSAPVWLRQAHGTRVVRAERAADSEVADAAVAFTPGIVCVVTTADCLPVFFCDRAGQRVAVAHAGWRGLAAGVLEETLTALACPPAQIMAWLGPAIGPGAFEVGDEVRAAFIGRQPQASGAFVTRREGHWLADLYALARLRLAAAGVEAVHGGGLCTYSDPERFYSYRRDGATGRMASLIWLAPH